MKVSVDKDLCISCGLCMETCPDVFEWDDDNKSVAADEDVPADLEESVHEAVDNCPTNAISSEE